MYGHDANRGKIASSVLRVLPAELGILTTDSHDVAHGGDLELRHRVHADLAVEGDDGRRPAVDINLEVEVTRPVDLAPTRVGNQLLVVREGNSRIRSGSSSNM